MLANLNTAGVVNWKKNWDISLFGYFFFLIPLKIFSNEIKNDSRIFSFKKNFFFNFQNSVNF